MNVFHGYGINQSSIGASITVYQPMGSGGGASAAWDTTESRHQIDVASAGTVSNLGIYLSANDRTGGTFRARINAANGNQTMTFSGTGRYEDTANTDSWDAAEEVNVQIITGTSGTTFIPEGFSFLFAPSSGTVCYIVSDAGKPGTGTATLFNPLLTGTAGSALSTTEANNQNTIAVAATMQNQFTTVSANTRSDTTEWRTRINGVNGNSVCSYATTVTGDVQDTVNTDSVADGDELNYAFIENDGTGQLTIQAGSIEFSATNAFPIFGSQQANTATAQSANLTRYLWVAGSYVSALDDTEADKQITTNVGFTWSDLYGYLSAYSLNSGNYIIRSRINAANGNMVITFTATGQQSDVTNTDTVADDDEINYSSVTGGTTGAVTLRTLSSLATAVATATSVTRKMRLFEGFTVRFISGRIILHQN